MKTVSCYFSGTGNFPANARKIAAGPGNTEPVPFEWPRNEPRRILPAADKGRYRHPGPRARYVESRQGKAGESVKTGRDTLGTG